MEEKKVTIMELKVDLQCYRCYNKVKKVLSKFPQIRDQRFDEKANTVTIKVVSCYPEQLRDKLCCKGGCSIKCIKIIIPPSPPSKPPLKPPPTPPPPPPPICCKRCHCVCVFGDLAAVMDHPHHFIACDVIVCVFGDLAAVMDHPHHLHAFFAGLLVGQFMIAGAVK